MSSTTSFTRQINKLVFSIVFASLLFLPKTISSIVQAAELQRGGVVLTDHQKGKSNPPIEKRDWEVVKQVDRLSTASFSASRASNLHSEEWKSWAVAPSLSSTALSIYKSGLAMGNNPRAFSKVGDGEISAAWFLTDFDRGADYYDLGTNTDLQATIAYFAGSFSRQSQSARRGFNAQRILDPARADTEFCQINETPLDCEIRLNHPSFALISMGTNQVWQAEQFESGMRTIIETLIAKGVVPVLSTKADNLEGDDRINLVIARLAAEYDLPLWNFWLAVQPLPNHGLQEDQEHLTYYPNNFGVPNAMQFAWPVRNLSALQVLQKLMEDVQY